MAKTSGEFETEFIQTTKEKTGRSLEEWLNLTKTSGLKKQNEILDWLKKEYGLNHMQAQFVAGIYLNNGNPVFADEKALLDNQFIKCLEMRPLFDAIAEKIISSFHGTQLIAKKTYLSFTASREFAAINAKPKEIRLGLDLGELPFNDRVQKTKLAGPMPRISHMVVLTDINQMDLALMQLIEQSYNRTHKK
jgi:predicted transport protein